MQFSLRIGAETSAFAVVSATAASAGLFGCSNVCFNRRIQDQFQFQKTENGIEISHAKPTFHSMFCRPANARSVVIQNRKPFSNRADPSERRQNELDRKSKIEKEDEITIQFLTVSTRFQINTERCLKIG